jgi:hypothetical protein
MLAVPPPATIPDKKDEELVLALVDLLIDAISIIGPSESTKEQSDEQ